MQASERPALGGGAHGAVFSCNKAAGILTGRTGSESVHGPNPKKKIGFVLSVVSQFGAIRIGLSAYNAPGGRDEDGGGADSLGRGTG